MNTNNPVLLQINTRVYLNEISHSVNRPATLDDIPDTVLNDWSRQGFDWIYLLSVWQTGEAGRQISRTNTGWKKEFGETLSDLREEDIVGSGFAITGYQGSESIGGDWELARFRRRLNNLGMKLMLDFVPNHTAPDHPWVEEFPEFFIQGSADDLKKTPENFIRIRRKHDEIILAHGRDPNFSGWPDTLQLNYGNPRLQEAMAAELEQITGKCDGVRCDMAMLLLPHIFRQTWGIESDPFWPDAIQRVKQKYPGFLMMGEVYWDLEWTMQQQGFDYTYDKRLYDRLLTGEARPVREHLLADLSYQEKMVRFLENHDEPRAASLFSWNQHQAAAIITFLIPGMKFFHHGEMQGWHKKIPVHLKRGPEEVTDPATGAFYKKLLEILHRPDFHQGTWQSLSAFPAWEGNPTHDNFVAFAWRFQEKILVLVINYAAVPGQCYLSLPFEELAGTSWYLRDLFTEELYKRPGAGLLEHGLYVARDGWGFHVFDMKQEP